VELSASCSGSSPLGGAALHSVDPLYTMMNSPLTAQQWNPWNCAYELIFHKTRVNMPGGKLQKKSPKGNARPKRKNQSTQRQARPNQTVRSVQPRTPRQVGIANRVRLPTVGMSDLIQHRITWVACTVYIGNATLGAADSVYAASVSGTPLVYNAGAGGGFWIPFAPGDVDVGSTYASSIMKLYRRVRIRSAKVHLLTIQSSTTNNAVVGVAPCRGPPGAAEFAGANTGTGAAQTLVNLMSISGMTSCDSFENTTLDLTPYIAAGSGASQNEFSTANSVAQTTDMGQVVNAVGVVPCAFQIAGNSNVTALRGTITHNVVCEMVCDLLDFVGGVPVIDPSALVAHAPARCPGHLRHGTEESKEEKRARLLSELSAIAREDRERRDVSSSPTRLG